MYPTESTVTVAEERVRAFFFFFSQKPLEYIPSCLIDLRSIHMAQQPMHCAGGGGGGSRAGCEETICVTHSTTQNRHPRTPRGTAPPKCAYTLLVEGMATMGSSGCWAHALRFMFHLPSFQMHQAFYQSLLALAHKPRCLQHLCRCAIRKLFGKRCFHLVPLLPLPKSLQDYLLLEPEGVLHWKPECWDWGCSSHRCPQWRPYVEDSTAGKGADPGGTTHVPALWMHWPPWASCSLGNGMGLKRPFCLSGSLVRIKTADIIVFVSESTSQQKLN